ncbi:transposase [Gilliamella sp. App2-1]|nr:transposase [Gilliamella apicola]OCG22807.1 transposase [Gilliamella apicola]
MVRKFSVKFKQQLIEYALPHAHFSISELANHLGIDKSTLDKWIRQLALCTE